MFLKRRLFKALRLSFDSRKRQFERESIMVLDGAMENEELALMPVCGYDAGELDADQMQVFIFGDDDELDDEDDFDDGEDDFEEEVLDDDDNDDDDDEDDYDDDDYDDDDDDYDEDDDNDDWGNQDE
jgi:hypothetical protein